MLVFQYNSKYWERLQVSQVTSESTVGINPTGHSLGGLPNISGAPNQKLQNHSKTSIPTQAHHVVICASQALNKAIPMSQTLTRLTVRKRTQHLHHTPRAWPRQPGHGRGVSRQGCGKNQDPILQPLLLSHWRLWVWGNISRPDPYHPYLQQSNEVICILVQTSHLIAWQGARSDLNRVFILVMMAWEQGTGLHRRGGQGSHQKKRNDNF